MTTVAVIGAGPAGLMAAEILGAAGLTVTVLDRMPSVARKFLIAGRGGLNLTHSEPLENLKARYGAAGTRLSPLLEAFPPQALIDWAEGLGQPTFIGTSGRVFPKSLKASPLLRAWLARLKAHGVAIKTRHDWRGWSENGQLLFAHAGTTSQVKADATILALGGASWPRLGSNGAWVELLAKHGVPITPLRPANCGFTAAWSEPFRTRFEGQPLKSIALTFDGRTVRGEAMVTRTGLEGGAIYALSAALRDAIAGQGAATLEIDLRPDMSLAELGRKLDRPRAGETLANFLRKAINLAPVGINLLREGHGLHLAATAEQIKSLPIKLTGTQSIDRAISTAGGIALDALDGDLMLRDLPNVYAVGEMLDWEAPTGGYLLQATFATAVAAAKAIIRKSKQSTPQ
ncbi:MAG: TIGR03862 family flavoprotein [Alphaproteobacteria bacterium]|nr:TIGR03862 family flavoprotein [Alphaproteobacteria bacterium]